MDGGEARIEPLQATLLEDPLAFLSAERARQRALLGHLERIARHAAGRAHGAIARALVTWLAIELPLHLIDEEASVHARLGAGAAGLLAGWRALAREVDAGRGALRDQLAAIAGGHKADEGFARAALEFGARYRRLLEIEEAELLPLARRALSSGDRAAIAREMSARRH